MKKRIVVFAPHPDDETFGCGGTIAKKIKEGYEVIIVLVTDGRYAFSKLLGIESDPTPIQLKEIRKEEVKRATKILGVKEKNLFFLDFEDGSLYKHEKELQEKIIEILKKTNPVEVYFPYEKDSHPDHRAVNRVVRDSIRRLGLKTMKYKYSVGQKYGRIGPLIDIFLNLFKKNMIWNDISEFLPTKRAAIEEFKSEISIISRSQKRPLMRKIGKFLKNKEIFYIDK